MLNKLSSILSTLIFFGTIVLVVILSYVWELSQSLPDIKQLAQYEPAVTTRLYAGDGQVLKEYAIEKRFFIPCDKIPQRVKNAFIAAEDKKFYTHGGVDYIGIIRAILGNIKNFGKGRRPSGASTITQQVAKNMLLSSEVSYVRKIKEAFLAYRLEEAFSKEHILELYLNEIYLGNRSYGVGSAAMNYFGKQLKDLTIEEAAYLAALPKGPNNYHPIKKHDNAVARRDWVIFRMLEEKFISEEEANEAVQKPLEVINRNKDFVYGGDYFAEEVRKQVQIMFGDDAINEGGLMIRTTVDPTMQEIATKTFVNNLQNYDRRHGYRGPITNTSIPEELEKIKRPLGTPENWKLATVVDTTNTVANIIDLEEKVVGKITLEDLKWARTPLENQYLGPVISKPSDVLKAGDVILVEIKNKEQETYHLRQIPDIEGGFIALDPHTGKILALVGGYSFKKSEFNRAIQAFRQTGSAFKPFVYLAALENGYSPNDLILDAPFVYDQGPGLPKWKPKNYSTVFYGLTTLRKGVEKSRNLMTVRLAQALGMNKVSELAKRIGINNNIPEFLSMSLGAHDAKLIDMTTAYAIIVNGGKKITPYFIEQIQDRYGKSIYKQDKRECKECKSNRFANQDVPKLPDLREQIIDPQSAYQMTSILQGVVQRGTGGRLRYIGKNLGGKTGTTNDSKDAWFIGFSPNLIVGAYVGFDQPRTLGKRETGASAALPIVYDFFKEALKNTPDVPFRIPAGIKFVRVNEKNGKLATFNDDVVITEALKPDFSFENGSQKIIGGSEEKDVIKENKESIQLGVEY
ncbi:MAG: penicillin-binding protein 1A [Alphaproteobacteria bacterium]